MKQNDQEKQREFDASVMLTWFVYERPNEPDKVSSQRQQAVPDQLPAQLQPQTLTDLPGRWRFRFSTENVIQSREAALSCPVFMADDEDEMVDDVLLSCVNCMRRRWLIDGFECRGLPQITIV